MDERESVRLYTVEEARGMLPELRQVLTSMQDQQRQLIDELEKLNELTPAIQQNGHAPEMARLEQNILMLGESLHEELDELVDLGIAVKDIANGVIDFPSERDGRIVYLCWQVDEETITHWHELDSGFIDRQPLDE